jgi:hypothetical protein
LPDTLRQIQCSLIAWLKVQAWDWFLYLPTRAALIGIDVGNSVIQVTMRKVSLRFI